MEKLNPFSESSPRIGSPSPALGFQFQIPSVLKRFPVTLLDIHSFKVVSFFLILQPARR